MQPDDSPDDRSQDSEPPISVIGRVFAILRVFGPDDELGVSEIARATGLPKSTVHRIAAELVDERVLIRVDDKYRPGLGLFDLGMLGQPWRLREVLAPYLEDLQRVTGGDVQIASLEGSDVVYLNHVGARGSTAEKIHLGSRLPANTTAAGKLLLAHVPADAGRFAEIREQGWASDIEEAEPGRMGVAVPIRNRHGRIIGALSITGPVGSLPVDATVASATQFSATLTKVGKSANVSYLARLRPVAHPD